MNTGVLAHSVASGDTGVPTNAPVNKSQAVSVALPGVRAPTSSAFRTEFLDQLQKMQKLNDAVLAKRIGISPGMMSHIRAGRKPASRRVALLWAKALGADSRDAWDAPIPGVRG